MEDVATEQEKELALEKVSGIKFKASKLASGEYALVKAPGQVILRAAHNVTEANLVDVVREDGGTFNKYIVTLKASSPDQYELLKKAFLTEDGKGVLPEIPIEKTNGCFLTANLIQKQGLDLPMANQEIKCDIQWVTPKDEPERKLLRVQNAQPVKLYAAKERIDLNDFFANPAAMDEKTPAEEQETLKQPV